MPDVDFLVDDGGVAQAAPTPVAGADAVAGVLAAGLRNLALRSLQWAQVNGYPALTLRLDGEIDTVLAVRVDEGLIAEVYSVRDPQKLSRLQRETTLRR